MIAEVQNQSPHASGGPVNRTTNNAESTRRPAQVLAAYRRDNPRRELDWRWQRAKQVAKEGSEPDPLFDDGWTRRAYEYRQLVDDLPETLVDTMPDIYAAHQLKATGGATCWELEASILSRETPNSIQSKTGIAATVIECYEKMFFNVRGHIDCIAYITAMAIGECPFDGNNVAAIWNHVGYWFGPYFLDAVIDDSRSTGKADYTHLSTDRDWWKGRSRFQRTLDRSIALLMFKVDSRNLLALLRIQSAVASMQQRDEPLAQRDDIADLVDEAVSDVFSAMSETDSSADATEELVA